ncbi:hypothetical protein AB832_07090 [Flavobacteriaceae bacterium (ex Bugula neritina AB1)]|nr:hypothetical protein AB832_07090 [Flavobacteriaceae bacterium (ex Bugula neritina AB1)]
MIKTVYISEIPYHYNVNTGEITTSKESLLNDQNQPLPINLKQDYQEYSPQLQISLTDACNLNCTYCSFRARVHSDNKPVNMPIERAKESVKFFYEEYKDSIEYARVDFGLAGEPLLMRKYHNELTEFVRNEFKETNAKIIWTGTNTTNGTIFLKKESENLIGPPMDISCDGPQKVHDTFRRYTNDRGTYRDLESVIKRILKKYPSIGVSAVLTAENPDFIEIFHHLFEVLGFRNIYMKPVNVTHDIDYGLNPQTLTTFKESYSSLINYILTQEPEKILAYLQSFDSQDFFMRFFYRILWNSKQVFRCGAGKSGVYVDTNGKLYPCAHFIGKSGWDIGDIYNGFDEKKRDEYRDLHVDKREPCKSCWAKYLCGGGCYYQAVLANGSISSPDETKCDLVRHLSHEAIRLFISLRINHPQVLNALNNTFYISNNYLSSNSSENYIPKSYLAKASQNIKVDLTTKTVGSLKSFNHLDLDITLTRSGEIIFNYHSEMIDLIESFDIWLLSLETEGFSISEILNSNIQTKGTWINGRRGEDKLLSIINNEEKPVRKIPYKKYGETSIERSSVLFEKNRLCIRLPIRSIMNDTQVGFNITLNLNDQGTIPLIRYEPFCLLNLNQHGNLITQGGEFNSIDQSAELISQKPIEDSISIHRFQSVRVNVC